MFYMLDTLFVIACFPVCVYLCSYMIICAHECRPARVLCGALVPSLYCNISYYEIKLHLMYFIMECKVCGYHFRYRVAVIWQDCCWQQDVFSQLLPFTIWRTLCIPIIWAWRIFSTKIRHCGEWYKFTYIMHEPTVSIFKVLCYENGGSRLPWNNGNLWWYL
jgi:hypothetical protein